MVEAMSGQGGTPLANLGYLSPKVVQDVITNLIDAVKSIHSKTQHE